MLDAATDAPKATPREWAGLAVLALPCLLYSMDLTVLNLAAPQIAAEFEVSASQLLWIMDVYGFLLAGSLITMGTLGDRIGRRRLLMIGAGAFGAASALAAFSTSAEMLVATRALFGVAGATLAPSTLSLIRNMFLDDRQRTLAIGVWIACFSTGAAIGPLVGGVLLSNFWWGSVFLLNVPVMALLLVLGPWLLPEFRDPKAGRLDLVSAALSLVAVLAVIYGVKKLAEGGSPLLAACSIVAGLAAGAAFLARQRTLPDPLIDVSLFRKPMFAGALGVNVFALFIAAGFFFFVAQYLQLVIGLAPFEAGLWTAPSGAALAVGSLATPLLLKHFRRVDVLAGGFALSCLGFAVLAQADGPDSLAAVVAGFVILGLGLSPVGTLTTDLTVGLAPPERAGAAAALSETSFEFGAALGIAVLGSVVTAIYRSAMTGVAIPQGVSPEAVERARTMIGGAAAVASEAGPGGVELLAQARDAFVSAFVATSWLCAALSLAAAMLIAVRFRHA